MRTVFVWKTGEILEWKRANPHMACESAFPAIMDEQALMGLNPNADACYRQRVRSLRRILALNHIPEIRHHLFTNYGVFVFHVM